MVFICEQKLYTKSQLNQHKSTGDSEVDGNENERGGFMGHPICDFCRNRFYGDNELYTHMATEHYTCHICQRQHPGQYDYFRDYTDLELHFRQEHFLCEDEACLEKKFVVFQTEAEMKRHNTLEHGGHMSRSKRNAALRIPTSFRYRQTEQEMRRGRGRGFRPDPSSNAATRANLEAAVDAVDGETNIVRDSSEAPIVRAGLEAPVSASSSLDQSSRTIPILEESSFPPLAEIDLPEPSSSRYAQALSQSSRSAVKLVEESFPPLPGATSIKPILSHESEGAYADTLAARIQRSRGSVRINSSPSRPPEYHEIFPSTSQLRATPSYGMTCTISQLGAKAARENGFRSPSSSSPANLDPANRVKHSSSAPILAEVCFPNQATPVMPSGDKGEKSSAPSSQYLASVGDVYIANKSLVERIRAGLGMDEEKYSAFKCMSSEYRQGLINTWEYLSYVEQFGLSHLVLELARLCPDAQRQKELIDAYKVNLQNKKLQQKNGNTGVKKGKGKAAARTEIKAKDTLADNFLDTVRTLQVSNKVQEEEVEILSKDGYRVAKEEKHQSTGKEVYANSRAANAKSIGSDVDRVQESAKDIANQNLADGGSSKQRKKTTKFHKIRLGDGSAAVLFDLSSRDVTPDPVESSAADGSEGPAVRGVWRSGGAQRLFANSNRNA